MYFIGSEWVKYVGFIVYLYWKVEGLNEWILFCCDVDYLFNCNYGEGYIWDEMINFIFIIFKSW